MNELQLLENAIRIASNAHFGQTLVGFIVGILFLQAGGEAIINVICMT